MTAIDTYYRGESIPFTLTITDKDSNVIDLDTLHDIEVTPYHQSSLKEIGPFTLSGGTVTKTDAPNGICDIIINGTDTDDILTGLYIIQVKTTETDADYTPKRYRYGKAEGFILKPSI